MAKPTKCAVIWRDYLKRQRRARRFRLPGENGRSPFHPQRVAPRKGKGSYTRKGESINHLNRRESNG